MENQKKSRFQPLRWLKRMLFTQKKELSFAEEEALQSPLRMIFKKFFSNKLSRFGFIMFVLIFLLVMIGPYFLPIDLSYQDNTQANVPPGANMMRVPDELKRKIRKIIPGITYAIGIDTDGKLYIWGHTAVTEEINLRNIPEEVTKAKLVDGAAGYDHVVVVDENGKLYTWGSRRLGQDKYPDAVAQAMKDGVNLGFQQISAGNQFTVALDQNNKIYTWGNANINDIKTKKAFADTTFQEISTNINNFIALTTEGAVAYIGRQSNAYSAIPSSLDQGVTHVASTAFTNAAVKADGSIVVWGNASKGENIVPQFTGKVTKLIGGRYHYTLLTDEGKVVSWGDNFYHQSKVPVSVQNKKIVDIFVGHYQNYAIDEQGNVHTWGLNNHILGTDHFGREILTRIINGGQVTMTVGAISVIISLIIGVSLGGIAGYFGGKVDMFVMRLSEVIGGLPFLPFALILSAIIGTSISVENRMYLIMVVLGVLSWPSLCRLVRAQILAQREMEFVTAAKAMGVKELAIVFKHIVPNVISVILVSATLSFASSMLTESTLSYLGFGISPPTPTWGNMLQGANNSIVIQMYWWRWVFPALILSICTICINLIGDGLRDAIDPKSNER